MCFITKSLSTLSSSWWVVASWNEAVSFVCKDYVMNGLINLILTEERKILAVIPCVRAQRSSSRDDQNRHYYLPEKDENMLFCSSFSKKIRCYKNLISALPVQIGPWRIEHMIEASQKKLLSIFVQNNITNTQNELVFFFWSFRFIATVHKVRQCKTNETKTSVKAVESRLFRFRF